jgi:hypothetical protein
LGARQRNGTLKIKEVNMKKLLIFLMTISWIHSSTAQNCLPNGIKIDTQSQIDNFQNNYPGCTQIDGNVEISYGYDITNLNGLNVLKYIGGALAIVYNPYLTSLMGLNNLTAIWGNLIILYNESLTTCEVQSICDYLANPNGTIEIGSNATGCNSQQEVEAACATISVEESKLHPELLVYPNPSSTLITIETSNKGHLSILNLHSQEIVKRPLTENKTLIDISNLPCSVYIIRFQNEDVVQTGKLIKK